MANPVFKRYLHPDGRVICVAQGFGQYFAGWVSAYGSNHRLKSPQTPARDNPYAAQSDLDAYAAKRKWPEVTL